MTGEINQQLERKAAESAVSEAAKALNAVTHGTDQVVAALAAAQAKFPDIKKGRTAKVRMKAGGEYSYSYADLSDIMKAVYPVLAENGLAVTQCVVGRELATDLWHKSGQRLRSVIPMVMPADATPQSMGSALTYSRRYGACLALGIVAEEDDDGQTAQNSAPRAAAPAAKGGAPKGNGAPHFEQGGKPASATGNAAWQKKPATSKQVGMLKGLWNALTEQGRAPADDWHEYLKKNFNKKSATTLTGGEASQLINYLKSVHDHVVEVGSDEDIRAAAEETGFETDPSEIKG